MHLFQYFVPLALTFSTVKMEFVRFDRHDYVQVITDVCKTYHISAVFFTHSGELKEDLSVNTVLLRWTRALSHYGIATLNIHLWRLWRTSVYYNRIVRPLFIIVLTDDDSVRTFSIATKNMDVSFPTWFVIFVDTPNNYERDYCHDPPGNIFHVTFHTKMLVLCEGDKTLREWYALDKNLTKIIDLAVWRPEGLVLLTNSSLYERRNNMEGMVLRAVVVKGTPYARMQNGIIDGYFGKVLHELTGTMNFSFKIVKEAPNYGRWHPENNSWDGAIADLISGNVDIGISDFSMTSSRTVFVDFTLPLSISRDYLFVRELGSTGVQWLAYFWAFSSGSWISIVMIIIFAPPLLAIVNVSRKSYKFATLLSDNCLYVWGIFCQQGLPEFPSGSSLRLAYVSIFLTALVVSAMYSAALISFLAIYIPSLPFSSFEEFVTDGTYKLVTLRGSAHYDIFANSSDLFERSVMRLIKEEKLLPSSIEEGFDQVCDPNEKVAYFATYDVYKTMRGKLLCKVAGINAGRIDSIGIAMIKGSPYTDLMNFLMQKFSNNGMLDRMKRLDDQKRALIDVTPKPIGLDSIAPILAILLGGFILSVLVLSVEILYFGNRKKAFFAIDYHRRVNIQGL